jgi:hypothetical protein
MAKEIFAKHAEVKKKLWGGKFWSDGYYVSTVGKHGNENTVSQYVKNQGVEKEYKNCTHNNCLCLIDTVSRRFDTPQSLLRGSSFITHSF